MRIPEAAIERVASVHAGRRPGAGVRVFGWTTRKSGGESTGETATCREEQVFKNGRLHGIWRQYHQNGKLFALRPYRDGLPDGTFVFRDKSGQLLGNARLLTQRQRRAAAV